MYILQKILGGLIGDPRIVSVVVTKPESNYYRPFVSPSPVTI